MQLQSLLNMTVHEILGLKYQEHAEFNYHGNDELEFLSGISPI